MEEPDTVVGVVVITVAAVPTLSSVGPSSGTATMAGVVAFCNRPDSNQTSTSLVARYLALATATTIIASVAAAVVESTTGNPS